MYRKFMMYCHHQVNHICKFMYAKEKVTERVRQMVGFTSNSSMLSLINIVVVGC